MKQPAAVVMNMFYTGLGIARSLASRGVSVFGLTSHQFHYGNHTRYARSVKAPDSSTDQKRLRDFLLNFGEQFADRPVLFPTRDHDLNFLSRYRAELERVFRLAIPPEHALEACLSKWITYQCALESGVPTPRCWLLKSSADLSRALREIPFPCVLKPIEASHWRKNDNWKLVGGRKAVSVSSPDELCREYAVVSHADTAALVQELIPGCDTGLAIVACYLDQQSELVAEFYTRKLIQVPAGFGTGCIVESAFLPELIEPTVRLLKSMRFSGIAEVEYKWNNQIRQYQLIEVNARPWDQHRLGFDCGTDLIYLYYCEHAGLTQSPSSSKRIGAKWIAEDTFFWEAARLLYRRDPGLKNLFRAAKGRRIYAIWDASDPLPFAIFLLRGLLPQLTRAAVKVFWKNVTLWFPVLLTKKSHSESTQGII